jgi:hypothetical protein
MPVTGWIGGGNSRMKKSAFVFLCVLAAGLFGIPSSNCSALDDASPPNQRVIVPRLYLSPVSAKEAPAEAVQTQACPLKESPTRAGPAEPCRIEQAPPVHPSEGNSCPITRFLSFGCRVNYQLTNWILSDKCEVGQMSNLYYFGE